MSNNLISKSSLPWLQKRPVKITIALLGLIIILLIMTINVAKYETHLATGDTVLLELAPVDPRGFMQGDYMTLRYAIEDQVLYAIGQDITDAKPSEGYIIVTIDNNNVGRFDRLADSNSRNALAADEMALYYRLRNGVLKLATNAFFFQEGHSEAFETAEYGLFRVNDKGEPLLTNMVDKDFEVIKSINNDSIAELENPDSLENPVSLENRGRQGSGM
ncbi:GDYXXLXY domain-containing protein [Psychrobacter sp. AH5]|uniref:GDYXXLXY domain-containing protein n=1 Tax=Psychrobacter sp. AH5 TaxID=2937433 RepID=UPI00333E4168